jgi:hypothetical protein
MTTTLGSGWVSRRRIYLSCTWYRRKKPNSCTYGVCFHQNILAVLYVPKSSRTVNGAEGGPTDGKDHSHFKSISLCESSALKGTHIKILPQFDIPANDPFQQYVMH